MRIEKIHLENIGVFDSLDLEFQPCEQSGKAEVHLFTGPNGSGKSTLLYALAGALDGPFGQKKHLIFQRFSNLNVDTFVEVLFEGNQAINYGKQRKNVTPRQTSYFLSHLPLIRDNEKKRFGYPYDRQVIYAYANSNTSQKKSVDDMIGYFLQGKNATLADNQGLSFAAFAYSGNRSLNSLNELTIEELELDPLDNFLSFLETTAAPQIIQFIAKKKVKQAIELGRNNKEKAEQYNIVIQQIEEAIQQIVGWHIEFILETEPLNLFLKVDHRILEFDVLPDGLKSIISFVADLIRRLDKIVWLDECCVLERHFILFLDEIDIHLHPAWQRKILPVIQKIFPNAQMFVSTHSPFVVGSVSDAYVYTLKLENGVSILDKVESSKAGSSYSLILEEIWLSGNLRGS